MPGLFVFLWSTGYIGAKWGLPYAEPFTMLAMRFAAAGLIFVALAVAMRAPRPLGPRAAGDAMMVGLLIQGVYLSGVFWSISRGTPAWLAALIAALQPLIAGLLAGPWLGERVTARHWAGCALGFFGVALVVVRESGAGVGPLTGVAANLVGVTALAVGTLYQKRHGGHMDLRWNQAIQQLTACAAIGALAFAFETRDVQWTSAFALAMDWLILPLSLGMFSLLYLLIRKGAVSRVSMLFFLVPPLTAIEAHLLFGEALSARQLAGMVIAVLGVAAVTWRRSPSER